MINYDYHKLLEPMEFQELSRDIVQMRDNIFLESYKEGKDGGVDGGCFHQNNRIILQAKRWKSGSALYSYLKNNEKEKVEKLNPDRYILTIATDLSPPEKEKIKALFHPYIKSSDDILCEKDFNNLLGQDKYKSIHEKYLKLLVPNTYVLKNMLNSALHGVLLHESAREFEEALRRAEVFVETRPYKIALKKLEAKKVVLISGEPGVGKTSIAYHLGRYFIRNKGYAAFYWVKSVDDIYVALRSEGKKVIVFDDFWGSIFQESSIAGKDEQRLAKIIERIKDDNHSVLILTTREYILKQGFKKHADLKEVVEKYKLECRLDQYRDVEKVKIFFGHLMQSKLTWQQTEKLFHKHREIVDHANFNPRVIEMFLRNVDIELHPRECMESFWGYLECPENFWKSIFSSLPTEAKLLSVILLISPIPIQSNHLEEIYSRCLNQMGNVIEKKSFQECISELERTVIKSLVDEEESRVIIKFQNPLVQEYLHSYLKHHIDHYFDVLFFGICYYNQLAYLLSNFSNDLSEEKYRKLFRKCIDNFESMPKITIDFIDYLDDNEFEYFVDKIRENSTFHQFFDLIWCYENKQLTEYQVFFEDYIHHINSQLGNFDLEIKNTDLDIYPHVIEKCVAIGISFNGFNIIKLYYNRICYEDRALEINKFKGIFPEEYQLFLINYGEDIKYYLEEYYIKKLHYYSEINDIKYCKYLCSEIPKQLDQYGIAYTIEFRAIIEDLMSSLDEAAAGTEEYDDDQEEVQIDESEIAYNEIVDVYEEHILGNVNYFWEDDLHDFIRNSAMSKSLKNELLALEEKDEYWYIHEFLKDEESFLFLEQSLIQNEELYKYAMFFTFQLIGNMSIRSDIPTKQFIGFLIEVCPDIMYRENAMLTKEEIISTAAFRLYFEDEERDFEKLVNSGLFVERGKWYELVNILLVMMPYGLFITNLVQVEKIDYYNSMNTGEEWPVFRVRKKRKSIVADHTFTADIGFYYFKNFNWERIYFKMFFELDRADYLEYYLVPMAQSYFQEVKRDTTLETIATVFKDLQFTIDIDKNGEIVGSQMSFCPLWRIIESLDIADIFELIPNDFSEEQMKYVAKNNEIIQERNRGIYRINLGKLENIEVLTKLGIDKTVQEVFGKICEVLKVC
ncbi:ATP-binding protein [Brevibacillus ruminantium]|uniref:ATP-binding protein n=1 Tax=Brevibacillus ruminantium TaxID=2950604 RepID=A0ABY4WIJ2_9BACL|nr:ATP-binding protein [Brevibacillus ruminantium]USG66524.1 ATP-binding protein [Brevibacillus ruminantium]